MIIGLAGNIGSGKSFTQLGEALQYANERNKQLVFNFSINLKELYKYAMLPKEADSYFGYFIHECRRVIAIIANSLGIKTSFPSKPPRLPWIAWMCVHGGIIQIPSPNNLEALLLPNSVVCLDEAGVFLNSREFAKTPRTLLAQLAQSRKFGCDLFWAAQFESQVDAQVRLLTQFWIHCDSLSAYDKKLKRPRLIWKNFMWFKAGDYMNWLSNLRDKTSYLKTRFAYSFKCVSGPLTAADKQLFKVFDSFSRLDQAESNFKIHTLYKCDLPQTYYLDKLGSRYLPQLDPMSKKYAPNLTMISSKDKDRQTLIADALKIARDKKLSNVPYFKAMTDQELDNWLSRWA